MIRWTRWTWLAALITVAAGAQDSGSTSVNVTSGSAGVSFTGDDIRIGVGVDDEGDINGEYFHVFGEDTDSAWIGELWASDSRGGAKLNYHWLSGVESFEDAVGKEDVARINKLFLAYDENEWDDKKVTFGVGRESPRLFWGVYGMKALSDERFINQFVNESTVTDTFVSGNGVFEQDTITTVTTSLFEHPYDYGIGGRIGTYFEKSLVRLRGGLDLEKGDFGADQLTLSLGLEKYFANTPHSLSLTAEYLDKSGDFEQDESDDTRAVLLYRYSFGERYRPRRETIERQIAVNESEISPVTKTERRPVRNRIEITDEAYFDFDRSFIRDDASLTLDTVIGEITKKEIIGKIMVVGHTCNIGTDSYNQGLSERRAASAVEYLITRGVSRDRIESSGKGESQPAYSNATEETRKFNRRVEIEFVSIEEGVEEVEVEVADPEAGRVKWVKEPITDPAWMERALRNPVAHKRTVDTYRYQTSTTDVRQTDPVLINTLPTAVDDAGTTFANQAVTIAVLANDSDPDGALRVVAVTSPTNGMATVNGDDTVTYTPNTDYVGGDSFTYMVVDSGGAEANATVSITVVEVPVIETADDQATTAFRTPVLIDVLANDSGDDLVLASVAGAQNGVAEVSGSQVRYTPGDAFFGEDTFTYTVTDSNGQEATATVVVTVAEPAALVANDDAAQTDAGMPVSINVLENDEGEDLELVSTSVPANGTATISADGSVLYEPNAGFVGQESFTYTVRDFQDETATATVTVTVNPDPNGNNAPIAVDDQATTRKNQQVTIDVLANDSDPDGDPLTVIALDESATQYGDFFIVDNQVVYQPNPGWWGEDEASYTVSDGQGGTATARIDVIVEE